MAIYAQQFFAFTIFYFKEVIANKEVMFLWLLFKKSVCKIINKINIRSMPMSGTKETSYTKNIKQKRTKNTLLWDYKMYFTPRTICVIYYDSLSPFCQIRMKENP